MTTSGPSPTSASDKSAPWAEGLLVGADVGGTATRVAVATADGEVLALATGAAGNPNAVGLEVSAERIRRTTEQCLASVTSARPAPLRSVVVGLAGGARADGVYLDAAIPPTLGVRRRLVSDLSVAFSSATPAVEGFVLVAGTGAVAGHVVDGELADRRDGWGWLLGDEGSGFWLGREVLRSTLTRLQAGQPLGALHEGVLALVGTVDPVAIVQLCYANPPIWLASFGTLVSRYAEDPAAVEIADRAAGLLASTLMGLPLRAPLPVVLAGSVATRPGPVRHALTERLDRQLTNRVLTAESGLVGALWLAAREIGVHDPEVHARLSCSLARTSGTVV